MEEILKLGKTGTQGTWTPPHLHVNTHMHPSERLVPHVTNMVPSTNT